MWIGFQATGKVTVGAFGALDYSYTVATDNQNARTIQGFSTEAKSKMYECEKCPYPTYKQFYDYYGAFDYANQWVLAAFNKASTTEFTNGKADFSKYQEEGQTGKSNCSLSAFDLLDFYVPSSRNQKFSCILFYSLATLQRPSRRDLPT